MNRDDLSVTHSDLSATTPGPWYADSDNEIHAANGDIVAWNYHEDFGATLEQITPANARRIVACVNACEGMKTEDMERMAKTRVAGVAGVALGFVRVADLQDERDELAAVLSDAVDRMLGSSPAITALRERALAALAIGTETATGTAK